MDNFHLLPPEKQQALLLGPATKVPDGETLNFANPPNRTSLGVSLTITLMCIASISFILRAYSRIFLIRRIRIEDGMI
jgi:hypothetical protein